MSNHPHQRPHRDDNAPESGAPMSALPPAPVNGHGSALAPNAAKVIGEAAGAAMAETLQQALPQALFSAFAQVLTQVPVQTAGQHLCATCIAERIRWEHAHRGDIEKAEAAAAQAAGIEPGNPQAGQVDFGPFLAEDLRPGARNGIPNVVQAATTVQGTEVCPMHIPGVQAGRAPLLVANAAMSPAMLGQLAGTRT